MMIRQIIGSDERKNYLIRSLILTFSLIYFVVTCVYYLPFISDDALISFRYARRLAEGRGLTWNDGYYVEGYSNLGWVLLIAAAAALKFDPVVASRCLGLAFTAAVLGVFAWRGRRLAAGASSVPAILALAASVHTLPIWAIGGLEQPLVLFCVFFGFFSVARWRDYAPEGARFLWCTSALFGVLALTRPDGILIAAAFGLSILFFRIPMAQRLAAVARLALVPACAIAGQGLFRLAYYGATVPNTARVKLGFSIDRLADGLDYVANGVLALSPLLLVIFLVAHRHGRGRDDILRAGSVALLAWIAYLVLIGGDIFPGYRHFTPVLAILFVMLLHTLSREPAFDPIGWTRRLRIPPVVFMMAVVGGVGGRGVAGGAQ
jgi:hypothetical protein